MKETTPEFIGKYKVLELIAKGGMGTVYKAVHPSLKRQIVIKKLSARRNAANIERFKREAQILLDLQSPYIVHLFDYFTEGSYRYMAEEFVDGTALDKLLAKQTVLSPQLAMLIMQDACIALKYAHSKDIVHRDIKPGNILISKRAEVKLADFGIATGDKDSEAAAITEQGMALGTPAYMPPEQFENSAAVDARADIYSLGVMLYEMVTGAKPYPSTLSIGTLNAIKKEKYTPPQKIDKTIPPYVCRLIKKAIRANPKRRYQSITPMLKAVQRYVKQYDTHTIRVQLARLVHSPALVQEAAYTPKNRRLKKMLLAAGLAAAAAASFSLCWFGGIIHRYALRKWFVPVQIEMQMPANSAANADLPVNAFFFRNNGADIPEVPNTRRALKAAKAKTGASKQKNILYATKPVFLRRGAYRMKVAAGPYVWWDSFTVKNEAVTISSAFLMNMRRPLKLNPHAFDGATGKEISAKTTFRVFYNGVWRNISELPRDKMLTGAVWKIKASCPGYRDEIFSLLLDWYQDELFISANMIADDGTGAKK